MLRTRTITAAIGATAAVAGLTIVGVSAPAGAASRPATVTIKGSVAPFTGTAHVIGRASAAQKLSIQVWLKPQTTAAAKYATEVSTPHSALFHHYLSPSAYTKRFGATVATKNKVAAWLKAKGFTSIKADLSRSYVRATASTAKVNAAFDVTETLYKSTRAVNAGRYTLRANNRAVTLPKTLAKSVIGVTGLDNASAKLPLETPKTAPETNKNYKADVAASKKDTVSPTKAACSRYYGQHLAGPLPTHFGTKDFPTEVCGYSAHQLREAYGSNYTNTGKGQTIALVELGLTKDMFLTLKDYAKANHLPAPSAERYSELSIGRGTACGDDFDGEEQLDVESAYAMAPAANEITIGGDSCNEGDYGLQGLFDADLAIIDGTGGHPLATIASNSWEGDTEAQPNVLTNIEHAYLVQAATEGVGMYFSSGDGSGVETPSSDPDAIAVGGTTLGLGSTGSRLFETGWSTGLDLLIGTKWYLLGEQGAAGGGPSDIWKQPSWQNGVVPNSLATVAGDRGGLIRSVPDISADADPYTGMLFGYLKFPKGKSPTYATEDIGGTSLASPLVAGMVAAAQQGQSASFGLASPAFFSLAGTSAVNDTLPITAGTSTLYKGMYCPSNTCGGRVLVTFDDQSPAMFGYNGQVTLKGYDNMSGVGTPHGAAFISALREWESQG